MRARDERKTCLGPRLGSRKARLTWVEEVGRRPKSRDGVELGHRRGHVSCQEARVAMECLYRRPGHWPAADFELPRARAVMVVGTPAGSDTSHRANDTRGHE
ncbi:uncharacterized protein MONBRDRAFT_6173 [Monosiga brevicollis MX1]|uniref:Uncharacterized protein n=1 Tax=Monosiga brevicollis TaxID=81824 RepID=A9UT17_MONBE|nr:uncharacterized protein MONBRDRAFT_6173 [Monosiga brevicollis MX1]EDQ91165.1 predicted protein [Monosiga brevicollis MX1]|eukprot:XP_001743587.1 hypothetical protein [Monosiga brevicollis MX1]